MKSSLLMSSILAASLTILAPTVVFAHAGHGDEFEAKGGINRVKVNAETDQILGIVVTPIAATAGSAVMIPVTALVDADGKKLAFVQYENFYEPVEVTTGATEGELIAVTKGLSVGEKLVTQGSLSLYGESRKTKTADTTTTPEAIATTKADGEGVSNSTNTTANLVSQTAEATEQGGLPMGILAAAGGGVVLVGGIVAFMAGNRKKNGDL
jgi:cation efflux system membrane fusion protein